MSTDDIKSMSFETAMKELETVVSKLESGDTDLAGSISLYERGAAPKERWQETLKEAEEKVAAITLDAGGQPTGTAPFEDN